jgi:hypothetical protein
MNKVFQPEAELWPVEGMKTTMPNLVALCTVHRNPKRAQGTTSLLARACWLWSAPDPGRLANGLAIGCGAGENAIRILLIWRVIEMARTLGRFQRVLKKFGLKENANFYE